MTITMVRSSIFSYICLQLLLLGQVLADCANPATLDEYNSCCDQMGKPDMKSNPDGSKIPCRIFQKKTIGYNGELYTQTINHAGGVDWCNKYCPKTGFANQTITCGGWLGTPTVWLPLAGEKDIEYYPYQCNCNNEGLQKIALIFIDALVAMANVICTVWVAVLTSLVDFAENLVLNQVQSLTDNINKLGSLNSGHEGVVQAARSMKSLHDKIEDARSAFGKWVNHKLCGSALSKDQTNQIFDAVDSAVSIAVAAIPVPGAQGEAFVAWLRNVPKFTNPKAIGDGMRTVDGWAPPPENPANPMVPKVKPIKPNDNPRKTDQDHKTTTKPREPTTTSPRHTTTTSTAAACKRKRGQGKDDNNCETLTYIDKSVEKLSTYTATCDWHVNSQACAHYYSVIQNGAKSIFTCTDSYHFHRSHAHITATHDWHIKQHSNNEWGSYTTTKYTYAIDDSAKKKVDDQKGPRCEADEWPPAYFMPEEKDEKEWKKAEWGQRIRWLPKLENDGAETWRMFCQNNDGGVANAQRANVKQGDEKRQDDKAKPLNEKFVDFKKAKSHSSVVKGTTHLTYDTVTFTRAVFEQRFEFHGKVPDVGNDWHLKENPCWPKAILPDDPGFPLLTYDNWYKTAAVGKAWAPKLPGPKGKGLYNERPSDEYRAAGIKALGYDPRKHPASPGGSPGGRPPPGQRPPPSKRLVLDESTGDLLVADDNLNVTRPLDVTERPQVEIVPCLNRDCSNEPSDGVEHQLIIPGILATMPLSTLATATTMSTVTREERRAAAAVTPVLAAVTGFP